MADSAMIVAHTPGPRKRWSMNAPPHISEATPLRIVLLGKSVSESSRVGNLILGRSAFDSEAPPDVVERVGGRLKDRHVTLINSPQLLQTNISDDQITQTVRECVSLSDPGPHVFIITLQYRDFTQEDMRRVRRVLNRFSEEAMKRTIIITTDEVTYRSRFSFVIRNNPIHQLMKECGGGRLQLEETKPEWFLTEFFSRVDEILKESPEQYLTCEIFLDGEESGSEDQSRSEEENENIHLFMHDGKASERRKEKIDQASAHSSKKQKLNLVLCGSDATFKGSVSKLLRGKKIKPLYEREVSSECVKKEVRSRGRLLSVVELPALSRLSEEEVMRQTLHCVSLCQPGVHAFIILVNVGPLNSNEKSEVEKIQKIFDSREHFVVLFTTDLPVTTPMTQFVRHSSESQSLISRCGGQYRLMGLKESENSRQIPDLLDYIENMKTEPYSLQMFVKAQENRVRRETEEKYEEELKRKEDEIKELKQKIQSEGAQCRDEDLECLRIVLIGKTGNGKSATGNTILGREAFVSEASMDSVTTVCEKGVGQANGRSVAVVDTPGLFDTTLSNEQVVEEIMKCVSLSSPGPHVFVIVLSLGKFTKEETDTLDLIKKIFGPKAAQFSIVLFTRGDELEGESIEDYVRESKSAELKKLIRDCGNRFLVFNNREKQDRTQVIQLFNMIEEVKNNNQGRHFTNSMFEEAEMTIKRRMEEIMNERESKIQTQGEALKAKYFREITDMTKRFEEEKRTNDDLIKIQYKYREKAEHLRQEFEEEEETERIQREIGNQIRLEEEKQQRAEFARRFEELRRDIEHHNSEYEKQQEREDDRKRDDKYKQGQEKMKIKQREEKEREFEVRAHVLKTHYEQFERERKEEWERIRQDKDERQEDRRKRWKKMNEDLKQEEEEEMMTRKSERRKREEKEQDEIKQKYEEEIKEMRKKHRDEARKQAEEFHLRERELQKQHNRLLKLYQEKRKEIKELQKHVHDLQNNSSCVIL